VTLGVRAGIMAGTLAHTALCLDLAFHFRVPVPTLGFFSHCVYRVPILKRQEDGAAWRLLVLCLPHSALPSAPHACLFSHTLRTPLRLAWFSTAFLSLRVRFSPLFTAHGRISTSAIILSLCLPLRPARGIFCAGFAGRSFFLRISADSSNAFAG